MASTTLTPSSIISSTGWTGATTTNLNSSNDVRATDGTAGEVISVELSDTPSDFGNVNGDITLRVEARTQGSVSRAKQITLELLDSSDNVLGSGSTGNLTATDATYTVAVSGRTDNKTFADGYRLRATVTESGGMADSATVEIDLLNVDVIYSIAASGNPTDWMLLLGVG